MMTAHELINKYGIHANKSLGQNFLHREDVIDNIAIAAAGCDCALEIGAGLGILSRRLCRDFKKVVTVEIDRSLERVTRETLSGVSNHEMVYADFLRFDLEKMYDYFDCDATVALVGNLPYNITGEIVTKLFKNHGMFEKAVIMVQKEAAQKLTSLPGTKQYRAVSVLTGYFCDAHVLFDVSADSFIPAPHVTSTVMRLDFKNDTPLPLDFEADFMRFVNRIFCQRRKMLTSVFGSADEKERAKSVLCKLCLPETARGEQLTPQEFAKLYIGLYM